MQAFKVLKIFLVKSAFMSSSVAFIFFSSLSISSNISSHIAHETSQFSRCDPIFSLENFTDNFVAIIEFSAFKTPNNIPTHRYSIIKPNCHNETTVRNVYDQFRWVHSHGNFTFDCENHFRHHGSPNSEQSLFAVRVFGVFGPNSANIKHQYLV